MFRPHLLGLGSRYKRVLLLMLPIAFLLVFFAYPIADVFRLAFTDFNVSAGGRLANFEWYFGNPDQRAILLRTFKSAFIVLVGCLFLGYPYAYLMTKVTSRTRLLLMAVVLLPFWTSLMVRTYSWVVIFGDQGPIAKFFGIFGLKVHLLGTVTAVTIAMIQIMLPFFILPLYSTLSRIDMNLMAAARSLGANSFSVFKNVYLPLSMPGVMAGSSIVFVISLGFYFTPALVGSPQNSFLSQSMVIQVQELLAFGRAGVMGIVLLVVTLVIMWAGAKIGQAASGRSSRL